MWVILVVSCVALGLFLLALRTGSKRSSLNLPPGPRGLPLVGFMPFLSRDKPYEHLDQLRKKYGSVFGMYMLNKYYLILGDLESTKEAFKSDDFTSRPDGCFQVTDGCTNFASTYGQHWFDHRRLASRCIRQQLLEKDTVERNIINQIATAVDHLEEERRKSRTGQVSLRLSLTDAVNGVTTGLLCGQSISAGQPVARVISAFQEAFGVVAASITFDRCVPWLKPLLYALLPEKRRIARVFKNMENYCWSEIESNEKNLTDEPKNFIEHYLYENKKPQMSDRFTRQDMNGDMQMMMFASGDTVRASTEWYLLCMAKYQDIQKKVYQEISDVLGAGGIPSYDMRSKMPYTEATILESMRCITLVPLCPVHSSHREKVTRFRGYEIPPDSIVICNLWGIQSDPKNWAHPELFYPEHFLTSDGKTVTVPETFTAFGVGKRICIGDKLALMEIFLFGVYILQRYQVLAPEGGVNLECKAAVTREPAYPTVRLALRA